MRKSEFLSPFITETVLGSKYVRQAQPFGFYSAVLGREVWLPVDFIHDNESVPLFKPSSNRAGGLHDYLCRKDSEPVVTKQQAADVYAEAQQLRDHLVCKGKFKLAWRAVLCWVKTSTVRVAPGYFHKHKVFATVEELQAR